MKALLIIDMQKGSFVPATPRYDATAVVDRINQLAAHCRRTGNPVIFVQHDGSREQVFQPGTFDWELLDELECLDSDLILPKTANSAFYQTKLDAFLKKQNIQELLLTGCATDFCVNATLHAALSKDYHIQVIADAHTTTDRPGLKARQVIDHYNWVWSDLTPTGGQVELITTAAYLSR